MNYFNPTTQQVHTESNLRLHGINVDDAEVLQTLELYPLTYDDLTFDQELFSAETDGDIVVNTEDPKTYIQHMKLIPQSIEDARRIIKARVTAKRYEIETGGIEVEGIGRFLTAISDQDRISNVMSNLEISGLTKLDFKTANGWTSLTKEQFITVAAAITTHVQACFSNERKLHEQIDVVDTVEDLAAFNITVGW